MSSQESLEEYFQTTLTDFFTLINNEERDNATYNRDRIISLINEIKVTNPEILKKPFDYENKKTTPLLFACEYAIRHSFLYYVAEVLIDTGYSNPGWADSNGKTALMGVMMGYEGNGPDDDEEKEEATQIALKILDTGKSNYKKKMRVVIGNSENTIMNALEIAERFGFTKVVNRIRRMERRMSNPTTSISSSKLSRSSHRGGKKTRRRRHSKRRFL